MRHIFLLTLTLFLFVTCGQRKYSKLTVILFDNQNPNYKVTIDTLLTSKQIDLTDTPVDLYFASSKFHLPYYVPTEGIYRNATKNKECDTETYPANVKCYEYDQKNRVIRMTVNGSGTTNNFLYSYNANNQIVEIADNGTKYNLEYNRDGTLAELKQSDGVIIKKLVFVYE